MFVRRRPQLGGAGPANSQTPPGTATSFQGVFGPEGSPRNPRHGFGSCRPTPPRQHTGEMPVRTPHPAPAHQPPPVGFGPTHLEVADERVAGLLATAGKLAFERHDIAARNWTRGDAMKCRWPRNSGFAIKLFHYASRHHTRGATWHQRLELFVPLDNWVLFQMGGRRVELQPGDL